jgi:predicted kinase
MRAIITIGISSSGKTTWAKEYAIVNRKTIITNRDDLRFSLTGATSWKNYRFDKHIEKSITELQRITIEQAFHNKCDIIVADTNLNPVYREQLITSLKSFGFAIEIKEFPISFEEACKRDSLRTNGVGRDVIYKQYQRWLEYSKRIVYVPNTSLPKAILVDVDGTLAKMGDRGAFEWSKVGVDTIRPIVVQMVKAFEKTHKVIVLSGRDSICRNETIDWLLDTGLKFDLVFMRKEGDMRKDTIIKEEIFWQEVAPFYNVEAVFDDRPSVVRMWHELKIPNIFSCADPNIEF